MPIDPQQFRHAMSRLATAIALVALTSFGLAQTQPAA